MLQRADKFWDQESSDVPESFLSSQSHEPFESESSKNLPSRVMTWSSQCRVISVFNLFLYIFGYRSISGPSMAIGPPVILQWLYVH